MERAALAVQGGAAGRMFLEQPERLTAAWRRERYLETRHQGARENLFEAVVESFIRQMGLAMCGESDNAWSTTRGVLRLSVARGEAGVVGELSTLRRCLLDAVGVVGATSDEIAVIEQSVNDAAVYALGQLRRLNNPDAPVPSLRFGGLVVEIIEAPARPAMQSPRDATVH